MYGLLGLLQSENQSISQTANMDEWVGPSGWETFEKLFTVLAFWNTGGFRLYFDSAESVFRSILDSTSHVATQ
jgi:hypothetical protein